MNHHELDRDEFRDIKEILYGHGKLFDALCIDQDTIPSVQQFQWMITGGAYRKLRSLPVSKYIVSPAFEYNVLMDSVCHRITFHFRFYRQYSEEESQCAIFLEMDEIPDNVKRLRVEIDMKCDKNKQFRQLLTTRVLSKKQRVTGFITFDHREVSDNLVMSWMFAVKMFDAEQELRDADDEFLLHLRNSLSVK